jgi:hypothetical protein
MNILLQPASGKEAKIHFKDTIIDGVFLSSLKKAVSASEYKKLREIETNPVQMWGFRPKLNGQPRSEWLNLNAGDLVLFYADRAFFYLAEVHSKIQNQKLARKFWGTDLIGRTWEHIYFIKKGSQIAIPFDPRSLGYSRKKILIGAILLQGQDVEIVKKQISDYSHTDFTPVVQEKKPEREYKLPSVVGLIPVLRDEGRLITYIPSILQIKKIQRSGRFDFEENNRRNTVNGARAEDLVINFEKKRLRSIGRADLAGKIRRVSLDNDYLGYDISSFDENGWERKIEVKSMLKNKGRDINFYISSNEKRVAETSSNYYIYLVRDVNGPAPIVTPIKNPFKNHSFHLEPTQFRVKGQFR